MQIGIDFGTCFSIISFMQGAEPYIPSRFHDGIPSKVMYSKAQSKLLFGTECCKGEALRYPTEVIQYIKKEVRMNPTKLDDPPLRSGGKDFTIRQILEAYLEYLIEYSRKEAEKDGGITEPIDAVTITAPVGIAAGKMMATDYRQLLQSTIQKLTGLPASQVFVLDEPVAAALSYLHVANSRASAEKPKNVLVFDLGGGTLDISVVEYDARSHESAVMANEGDLELGGNDWDEALAADVMKKMGIVSFSSKHERLQFLKKMNELKHILSEEEDAEFVTFKCNGVVETLEGYTRQEFEDATKPLLDRAMALVKKTLSKYNGKGITAIDQIVLVGGSCNMPQIADRLKREFSAKADRIMVFDPSGAIARGASVYARMMSRAEPVGPQKTVIQGAGKTYGFRSHNSELDKDMIFNMIFKGMSFEGQDMIEVYSSDYFNTYFHAHKDDQTAVSFKVFESENAVDTGPVSNWVDLDHGEKPNGMIVSVDVPDEWLGNATGYKLIPAFTLTKDGIFDLVIRDEEGNIVSKRRSE